MARIKKPAGVWVWVQRTRVKAHCTTDIQETIVNPSVRLVVECCRCCCCCWVVYAAEKSVLSCFTHECVSMPTAVHYGLCSRVETLDGPWCWESMLQGNRTSASQHNIIGCSDRQSGSGSDRVLSMSSISSARYVNTNLFKQKTDFFMIVKW